MQIIDGNDPESAELWFKVIETLWKSDINPFFILLSGIGHKDKDKNEWEFCSILNIGWQTMDLNTFECAIELQGYPISVFIDKDWRYYVKVPIDHIDDTITMIDVMNE
ncbi:MAG TPA: hypothetical protein VIE65_02720 [Methylobacter sp.]|jgi:predicted alpha/beta hydrolase